MGDSPLQRQPDPSHSTSQTFERIATRAGIPKIRLHDLRHTHGTLLIKTNVMVKVVSERLGHGNPAFTIDTYQHVLPGLQAEAARTFEQLVKASHPKPPVEDPVEDRTTVEAWPALL